MRHEDNPAHEQGAAARSYDAAGYDLQRSLPYLFNRVGVRLGELFEIETRKFGLSVPMYRVLASLVREEELSLGVLSAGVSTEISTLSRMVGTLARRGLVVRTRRQDDGRAVSIRLTPQGRAVADALIQRAVQVEGLVERAVGARASAALREQLNAIYGALDEMERQRGRVPRADHARD